MENMIGLVVNLLFYGTAKLLVPLVSFGRWQVDDQKSGAGWLSGWPFAARKEGKLYFSFESGVLFGVFFWIVLVIAFLA
jgi:hypothetical protein